MACRVLVANYGDTHEVAVLYCSTTAWAFGPLIHETDDESAEDRTLRFLRWLPQDARRYGDNDLEQKFNEFELTVPLKGAINGE